jgi:hypothetical protein
MVLLRPTTLSGIAAPKALPRAILPLYGIQLARVSSKAIERGITEKLYVFRNVPFTAVDPTPKQAAVRLAFAIIAHRAKGRKWEGRYPPAAEEVKASEREIEGAAATAPAVPKAKRRLHSGRGLERYLKVSGVSDAVSRAVGVTVEQIRTIIEDIERAAIERAAAGPAGR